MSDRIIPTTTGTDPADIIGRIVDVIGTDVAAYVAATGPDGTHDDVTAIVREMSTRDRRDLVATITTDHPAIAVAIPAIVNAPTGPDVAAIVVDRIQTLRDHLYGLVRGAIERGTISESSAVELIGAESMAMAARVAPDVALAESAERPTSGRTGRTGEPRRRRRIVRDWSNVNRQTFQTPGRTGTDGTVYGPSPVLVTVGRDGKPRFHVTDPATGDRVSFGTPTPAQSVADGWTRDGLDRGWGNPFDTLTHADGRSLGEHAPEVNA